MRRTTSLLSCFILAATACSNADDDVASSSETSSGDTDASTSNVTDAGDIDDEGTSTTTSGGSTTNGSTGSGDTSSEGETSAEDSTGEGGEVRPGPDFRMTGPHGVQTENGQYAIKQGCTMAYTRFAPDGVAPGGTVILAHGFQGNRGSMAGWANHLASWGLEVFTPDLCHATIFDANHAQNGADLIALREHLSLASVVYAGYSAGGLAAFLATANDASAVAVLGLDMVDNNDLGAGAAASVTVPAHDVVAEPAMCNTSGNGVAVFNATQSGRVLRVTEADHCDFQNPGDGFCNLCSAANPTFDTATIQATIIGLSTSFLVWQTGTDLSGSQWWFESEPWFDTLAAEGIISAL
jgi:hypothetical protein